MSGPPDSSSGQSQGRKSSQGRTETRPSARPPARVEARPRVDTADAPVSARVDARRPQGLELAEAIVTAGRAGERNITIEKFWVNVEGNLPCGFDVASRPGHQLEVLMEQQSYRRTWQGVGSLKTGIAPVAPIGTTGRIHVTDVTTGETLEQPWTWHRIGAGGFGGLWETIKRLIWKG